MSLANFSFPFQLAASSPYAFPDGQDPQSTISNLRLNAVLPPTPAPRFDEEPQFDNQPYITPAQYQHQHQQQQQRQREQQLRAQQSFGHHHHHHHHHVATSAGSSSSSSSSSGQDSRYANYNQDFRRTQPRQQQISHQQNNQQQPQLSGQTSSSTSKQSSLRTQPRLNPHQEHQRTQHDGSEGPRNVDNSNKNTDPAAYPESPDDGTYTRVNGGAYGSADAKTTIHAILDYDDDEDSGVEDYYDDGEGPTDMPKNTRVTPIQGPIYVKNGSVPVVPLYSYPQLNNGSFVQIPILWTALSVALGVELRGDLVKGTPCIKRHHQLYCPTAGKSYPTERIEHFIDENKALMKRMYGVFKMDEDYGPQSHPLGKRRRRNVKYDIPDGGPSFRFTDDDYSPVGETFFGNIRKTRQANTSGTGNESGRIDACESKAEIISPYWAQNSAAKTRAIVNTQHFEQAIHQEICSKTQTNRCHGDCGCEQKYKWHRLLAYDPDEDCKGIFMDWFLFPSCCVCRCDSKTTASRIFSPKTTTRN